MLLFFHQLFSIIHDMHRRCLTFSCARILQAELNSFIVHWNGHRIRTSRKADCPGSYPDDLHDMPEMFGISSFYKFFHY